MKVIHSSSRSIKNFYTILVLLLSLSFAPSPVYAQADLLQASPLDLNSQKGPVWEGLMVVKLANPQTVSLDKIKSLSVKKNPPAPIFLDVFERGLSVANQTTESVLQSTETSNSASSLFSQSSAFLLQGNAPIALQGNKSTSNTRVNLLVNAPTVDVKLAIPKLSSDGVILVDNLAQTITHKIISGVDNTLKDIPNSALSNSSIKFLAGEGISLSDTDLGLGETVTISTLAGEGLEIATDKLLTVSNTLTLVGTDGTTMTFPNVSTALIGATSSDVLTNKTISAASNTISNLTNTNLSGTAGITNANLANSSITLSPGTGLSGGGAIALGDVVSLTNTGVTSLTGTVNQVTASGSTGGITLSLPQNINTGATPTFSTLNLSSTANQLMLGTSNIGTVNWSPTTTRTLTLPDSTDTLIGKATSDVLTNKTLTAPTINGIIATTGLTIPAFTAGGSITGSGSPTISSFGAINGLTLTAASDGLTLAGGTTSRTVTVTGADITIGSTIKPTSAGALTIQSNGANILYLDSGGSASVQIGAANASSITLGATATVSAGKTFSVTDADKLLVGGTIIPQTIPIPVPLTATILTQPVFIADANYQVTGAKCIPATLSISGTFQVTVDTGTQAAGAGTSQLTGTISLSGTANTVLTGTLISSPTTVSAGDRVSAKFGGLLTGILGNCTIYIKRV